MKIFRRMTNGSLVSSAKRSRSCDCRKNEDVCGRKEMCTHYERTCSYICLIACCSDENIKRERKYTFRFFSSNHELYILRGT